MKKWMIISAVLFTTYAQADTPKEENEKYFLDTAIAPQVFSDEDLTCAPGECDVTRDKVFDEPSNVEDNEFYSEDDFYYYDHPGSVEQINRQTDVWPGKREDSFYDSLTR